MLPSRQRRTESPRRVDAGKVEIDRRKMHRGLFMYKLERGLHGLGFFFGCVLSCLASYIGGLAIWGPRGASKDLLRLAIPMVTYIHKYIHVCVCVYISTCTGECMAIIFAAEL